MYRSCIIGTTSVEVQSNKETQMIIETPQIGAKARGNECDDYTSYLWAVRLKNGRPYLAVYQTNNNGEDKGEESVNLGWIDSSDIQKVQHKVFAISSSAFQYC
jgi:hypothetical protein